MEKKSTWACAGAAAAAEGLPGIGDPSPAGVIDMERPTPRPNPLPKAVGVGVGASEMVAEEREGTVIPLKDEAADGMLAGAIPRPLPALTGTNGVVGDGNSASSGAAGAATRGAPRPIPRPRPTPGLCSIVPMRLLN